MTNTTCTCAAIYLASAIHEKGCPASEAHNLATTALDDLAEMMESLGWHSTRRLTDKRLVSLGPVVAILTVGTDRQLGPYVRAEASDGAWWEWTLRLRFDDATAGADAALCGFLDRAARELLDAGNFAD